MGRNFTGSGLVDGNIGTDPNAVYNSGQLFVNSSGVAFWKLNDGTNDGWYEVGLLKFVKGKGYEGSIAMGQSHAAIIKADGHVWTVGYNASGQLGIGTTVNQTVFQDTGVVAHSVYCGDLNTMAIKADGSLWCTGYNATGQLGLDCTIPKTTFQNTGVTASSVYATDRYTAIIRPDNSLWVSGDNGIGMFAFASANHSIFQDSGLFAISASVAPTFMALVKPDGTVWAFGQNAYGQLGQGDTVAYLNPTQLSTWIGAVATKVVCGDYSTHVLLNDGRVFACGYNLHGQLGLGTTADYWGLIQSSDTTGALTGVASIECGRDHVAVTKTDGSLWMCGDNMYGQLGLGNTIDQSKFQPVGVNVSYVNCYNTKTAVIKTDGTLWAAGYSGHSDLMGISTSPTSLTNSGEVPKFSVDTNTLDPNLL